MALETVVYSHDPLGYGRREHGGGGGWGYGFGLEEQEEKAFAVGISDNNKNNIILEKANNWDSSSSRGAGSLTAAAAKTTIGGGGRRKRRRITCKNKEELESQRMTHISVERNRRKQMNQYLAAIRSMMPPSFVQRADQASIIGGAINFVKELEQQLQTLEAQKRITTTNQQRSNDREFGPIFADFFTFPQYLSLTRSGNSPAAGENPEAFADIEVTMAESHANLKILAKKMPGQLLKIVDGLQCLWLSVLHLNATAVDPMVFYSINLKVEDGCQLTTIDEIADAVNYLVRRIQEDAAFS